MNFCQMLPKGWTQARYHDKLAKIAKVIIATGEENVPDLVGLCEVENDHCLKDRDRKLAITRGRLSLCHD